MRLGGADLKLLHQPGNIQQTLVEWHHSTEPVFSLSPPTWEKGTVHIQCWQPGEGQFWSCCPCFLAGLPALSCLATGHYDIARVPNPQEPHTGLCSAQKCLIPPPLSDPFLPIPYHALHFSQNRMAMFYNEPLHNFPPTIVVSYK